MTDNLFREEVRAFLERALTPDIVRAGELMTSVFADYDATMKWHRALHSQGLDCARLARGIRRYRLDAQSALYLSGGVQAGQCALVTRHGSADAGPYADAPRH